MMWQEMLKLGVESPACAFFFVDEEEDRIFMYMAMDNPRQHGISWTSSDLQEIDEKTTVSGLDVPIGQDWDEDLGY